MSEHQLSFDAPVASSPITLRPYAGRRIETVPFLSARVTDPPTSVDAAKSISCKTDREAFAVLAASGRAMTTDEVVAALDGPRNPPTVASAIARLHKAGHVVPDGEGTSARGRPAIKWKAVA